MSEYIKKPYTEEEVNQKVDNIRADLAKKLDKWADRIIVSMAYVPKIQRVEGERWIEDGKTWELKNGVKISVSKTQDAKMPWWCPKCSKPMNHRFDRKFYSLRGFCYNCNIEAENDMRLNGTWETFEKEIIRANEVAFLKDKINEKLEFIRTFTPPQLVFEDGRWEELAPLASFQELFEEQLRDIDFMLKRLELIKIEEEQKNESSSI